jgi:hypothetical protein
MVRTTVVVMVGVGIVGKGEEENGVWEDCA